MFKYRVPKYKLERSWLDPNTGICIKRKTHWFGRWKKHKIVIQTAFTSKSEFIEQALEAIKDFKVEDKIESHYLKEMDTVNKELINNENYTK